MSKQTPFFKFETMEWLGGTIQSCTLEEKGLFIDICALYWKDHKPVKIDAKFKVRYRNLDGSLSDLIGTLKDLELIYESEGGYGISFLDAQLDKRKGFLKKCSEAGKKSAASQGTSTNKILDIRKKKLDTRNKKEDSNGVSDETPELILEGEEEPKAKRNDYPEQFQAIWNIYGLKGNKKKSYALWQKLSEEDKNRAAEAVSDYLRETPDPQFRKYFERYLSQRVFDDVLERKAQGKLEIPKSSGPVETYIDPLNGMHDWQQYNLDDDYAPGEKEELLRKEAERKQKEKEAFLNSPETKATLENLKKWVEDSKKEGGQSNE